MRCILRPPACPARPLRALRSRAAALPSCRPRCSSTFRPSSIAELLRPSAQSPARQLPVPDGETLTVNGYVRTVRKQKRVAFAALGDGSTLQTVQAVLPPQLAEGSVTFSACCPRADRVLTQAINWCGTNSHREMDALARPGPVA